MQLKSVVSCIFVIISYSDTGFTEIPVNTTVCLGSTAQFKCACKVSSVASIFYLVNNLILTAVASQGISASEPKHIGDDLYVYLTVAGSAMNNNSLVTCKAILSNNTKLESSAYLFVQGM